MIRQKIAVLIEQTIKNALSFGTLVTSQTPPITIAIPASPEHGDFSCNIAMQLAKAERKAPRQVAEALLSHLVDNSGLLLKTEIAGPGFINFFIAPKAWHYSLLEIEKQGDYFGQTNSGAGQKVQVEFVSANPTGPLHIGHGRGAAIGDTICRILKATGWDVTREFYYNDAGQQIQNLALSVQARCLGFGPEDERWPREGYQGEYIKDVADAYLKKEVISCDDRTVTALGEPSNIDAIRDFAVAYLRREQDFDLKAFDVVFDVLPLNQAFTRKGK